MQPAAKGYDTIDHLDDYQGTLLCSNLRLDILTRNLALTAEESVGRTHPGGARNVRSAPTVDAHNRKSKSLVFRRTRSNPY